MFENPPNGGDQRWEYIELYGPPNFDLAGFAVVLIKGGEDADPPDEMPDGSGNQKTAEIDEAFSLDGWSTDTNGFFVLYNRELAGGTGLSSYLAANPAYLFYQPESTSNKRFLNGAGFPVLIIPSVFDETEIEGKLSNDGSSTYVLVRRRPHHALNAGGTSAYLPGYVWAKDTAPDIDFNSRLDFGDEHTLGVPLYFPGHSPLQHTAVELEPVQIVDEIAWSNAGGKEYNTSGRENASNKFSQSPGFNPDIVMRVRYITTEPMLGWAIDEDTNIVDRRNAADESWLYGETNNVTVGTADYAKFKPGPVDAATPTELVWLAPTNLNGNVYSFTTGDSNNPFVFPFFENSPSLDPLGTLLVEPYNISGVKATPGTFNDAQANTPLIGTAIAQQFRWLRGDFNFDGVVDCLDRDMIVLASSESWTLDDTTTLMRDYNTDPTGDDTPYTGYARRLEVFNATLAMIRMNLADGSTGQWTSGQITDPNPASATYNKIVAWGGAVTTQDLATFDAEFANLAQSCNAVPCPADFNGDGGRDVADLFAYINAWLAKAVNADFNNSSNVDVADLFAYINAWLAGC